MDEWREHHTGRGDVEATVGELMTVPITGSGHMVQSTVQTTPQAMAMLAPEPNHWSVN
jgi:hypothetical protein